MLRHTASTLLTRALLPSASSSTSAFLLPAALSSSSSAFFASSSPAAGVPVPFHLQPQQDAREQNPFAPKAALWLRTPQQQLPKDFSQLRSFAVGAGLPGRGTYACSPEEISVRERAHSRARALPSSRGAAHACVHTCVHEAVHALLRSA